MKVFGKNKKIIALAAIFIVVLFVGTAFNPAVAKLSIPSADASVDDLKSLIKEFEGLDDSNSDSDTDSEPIDEPIPISIPPKDELPEKIVKPLYEPLGEAIKITIEIPEPEIVEFSYEDRSDAEPACPLCAALGGSEDSSKSSPDTSAAPSPSGDSASVLLPSGTLSAVSTSGSAGSLGSLVSDDSIAGDLTTDLSGQNGGCWPYCKEKATEIAAKVALWAMENLPELEEAIRLVAQIPIYGFVWTAEQLGAILTYLIENKEEILKDLVAGIESIISSFVEKIEEQGALKVVGKTLLISGIAAAASTIIFAKVLGKITAAYLAIKAAINTVSVVLNFPGVKSMLVGAIFLTIATICDHLERENKNDSDDNNYQQTDQSQSASLVVTTSSSATSSVSSVAASVSSAVNSVSAGAISLPGGGSLSL